MAKTAKIDGFRKGKVPMSHIRSQYGAGIQQEVINDVIRDTVFEAIKSEDIRAVGMPNIDDVKLEDDFLVYQATVEIFPEIDVQGIDEIEVERHTATVSDEDVDTMIENLQKQRQEYVEKKVKRLKILRSLSTLKVQSTARSLKAVALKTSN
ncbi:hypothetical protein PKHYL_36590 [Psychrobacter sp. KH172YL61]|nr:hypothetical protein PKHYL_36590 [Psychrobacter sp. KH172YL61]